MRTENLCRWQRAGKQKFNNSVCSAGGVLYTATIPSSAFKDGDLVRWLVQVRCLNNSPVVLAVFGQNAAQQVICLSGCALLIKCKYSSSKQCCAKC